MSFRDKELKKIHMYICMVDLTHVHKSSSHETLKPWIIAITKQSALVPTIPALDIFLLFIFIIFDDDDDDDDDDDESFII